MNPTSMIASLLLAAAGSAALYLASPHQAWLARRWSPAPACVAGCVLLAASLAVLLQKLQPLTATYVWVTVLMLLFTLWPFAGALKRLLSGKAVEGGKS